MVYKIHRIKNQLFLFCRRIMPSIFTSEGTELSVQSSGEKHSTLEASTPIKFKFFHDTFFLLSGNWISLLLAQHCDKFLIPEYFFSSISFAISSFQLGNKSCRTFQPACKGLHLGEVWFHQLQTSFSWNSLSIQYFLLSI